MNFDDFEESFDGSLLFEETEEGQLGFDSLDIPEATVLSADYTRAVKLTNSIKVNAQMMQECFYKVCKGLEEVKNDSLYKEYGYQSFEDYCEQEIGIKCSQAKKYVAIAQRTSEEEASRLAKLGTEKFYLLAMLDEPQREQIQQKTNLESLTVKELKAQISDMKAKQEQSEYRILELETANNALEEQHTELENQIQELENRPVEVMQSTAELEEIEQLKSKLHQAEEEKQKVKEEADMEIISASEELKKLKAKISELENQPVPEAVSATKELFRIYFQTCTHNFGTMMEFAGQQKESPDFEFIKSKIGQLIEMMKNQLNSL